jgi:hypothetical protein
MIEIVSDSENMKEVLWKDGGPKVPLVLFEKPTGSEGIPKNPVFKLPSPSSS